MKPGFEGDDRSSVKLWGWACPFWSCADRLPWSPRQDFVLRPIKFDLVSSGHHSLPSYVSAIPLSNLPSAHLMSFLPASLSDEIWKAIKDNLLGSKRRWQQQEQLKKKSLLLNVISIYLKYKHKENNYVEKSHFRACSCMTHLSNGFIYFCFFTYYECFPM